MALTFKTKLKYIEPGKAFIRGVNVYMRLKEYEMCGRKSNITAVDLESGELMMIDLNSEVIPLEAGVTDVRED